MQIIKNNEKPIFLSKYDSFFSTTNLDWRKIYLLPRKTTTNMKLSVFQQVSGQLPPRKIVPRLGLGLGLVLGLGAIFLGGYYLREWFQYKILNNVLYLNKMLSRFGKVKSPLCSFFKSFEETPVHLFSNCSLSQNIQLNYSFRIILLSLKSHHRVSFSVLWKKLKINII